MSPTSHLASRTHLVFPPESLNRLAYQLNDISVPYAVIYVPISLAVESTCAELNELAPFETAGPFAVVCVSCR